MCDSDPPQQNGGGVGWQWEWDWILTACTFLEVRDVVSLSEVCRGAWITSQHDHIWRALYQRRVQQQDLHWPDPAHRPSTRWSTGQVRRRPTCGWKDAFIRQYLTDRNLGRGGHCRLKIHIVEAASHLTSSAVSRDHRIFVAGDSQGQVFGFTMSAGLLRRSLEARHLPPVQRTVFAPKLSSPALAPPGHHHHHRHHRKTSSQSGVQHIVPLGTVPVCPLTEEEIAQGEDNPLQTPDFLEQMTAVDPQRATSQHMFLAISSCGQARLVIAHTAQEHPHCEEQVDLLVLGSGDNPLLPRQLDYTHVESVSVDWSDHTLWAVTKAQEVARIPLSPLTGLPETSKCTLYHKSRNPVCSVSACEGTVAVSSTLGVTFSTPHSDAETSPAQHVRIFEAQGRRFGTPVKLVDGLLLQGSPHPEHVLVDSEGMLHFVDSQHRDFFTMNERVLCEGTTASLSPKKTSTKRRPITRVSSDGHLVAYGDAAGGVYVGGAHTMRRHVRYIRGRERVQVEDKDQELNIPVFSKLSSGSPAGGGVLSLQSFNGWVVATIRNQVVVHDFGVV